MVLTHSEFTPNRFENMNGFYEGILSPEEERNAIGMVLFKPDSTNSSLDLPIMDFIKMELEKISGKPVDFFCFTEIRINPDDIRKLYQEQKHEQYLKYIEDHFETGPIRIMLVAAPNAPQLLNELKGSIKTNKGVRGKFGSGSPIDKDTLIAWEKGELDPDTTKRIGVDLFAANLIHVPDDKDDTIRVMRLLLSKSEFDNLKTIPFVNRWLSN